MSLCCTALQLGSLKRLGTDYIDVYQLHWPARYSPQSNWGQSLKYNLEIDAESPYGRGSGGPTSFEDLCVAMEGLIQSGKIRGWGLCNDNAYGLTGCTRTAKMLGTTPPCNLQGDFSMLDRKVCLSVCCRVSVNLLYRLTETYTESLLLCRLILATERGEWRSRGGLSFQRKRWIHGL